MLTTLALVFLLATSALADGPPPNVIPSDDTTGNTAGGTNAMASNTTGHNNAGFGYGVLRDNTTGTFNSGFGSGSLLLNTTGVMNSGYGFSN